MTDPELIEQTLEALEGKENDFRLSVFERLFTAYPDVKELFLGFEGSSVRMSDEILGLLHGLATGEDWVENQTIDVIDLHQNYGDFQLSQFFHFAEIAVETVCELTGACDQQRAAWQRQAERLKPFIEQARADWD